MDYSSKAFLTSKIYDNKSKSTKTYLYIVYSGKDWMFYESAKDTDAKNIPLTKLHSNVGTRAYISEEVSLNPSKTYLQSKTNTNWEFRLYGKKYYSDITIYSDYIKGYLDYINDNYPSQ